MALLHCNATIVISISQQANLMGCLCLWVWSLGSKVYSGSFFIFSGVDVGNNNNSSSM
jgi:uncharacterized membrane protein YgdD (TMEM256/DUF423 family)